MTVSATSNVLGATNTLGFYNGSMSQYLEDSSSIFSTGYGIYGYNYGLGNDQVYQYAENAIDNQTSLQFAAQGNQYTLNSYNQIMQKELPAMADAIKSGEFGKASQIYREIYDAISQKNGEELTEQSQRVSYERAIKATITNMYQQVNGTRLVDDINEAGEGYFSNGFMQGLTLGDHHKNSAEETISYMTGDSIEGYSGKKLTKAIGKVLGSTISVGAAVGIGAIFGLPGAIIGGTIALGKLLFSDNSTETVTEG
jgi:hypothetical protein